ncbi:M14 family metallopeptidase [Algoriphagus sp. D3-2-R+10]|uniref:M14 family metallopeptidase n=1 Tax=Algoriphagus aurantiacus TaxID=3103948 RepID=UPI002B3B8C30|nr:M14 family metallopeptidase [Algoriphagus sp. D3-2-R+10]MEB2777419.1 M14 family metallopeptidase [Algoriphagus sp. D3-2-R+10]
MESNLKRYWVMGLMCLIAWSSNGQNSTFRGQGPVNPVNTESRPVERQWKGVFEFGNSVVSVTNDFDGARLNGMFAANDSTLVGLINPENTPVNMSPWYAFKLWAPSKQSVYVRLTYGGSARHRYHPKISKDGRAWSVLDSGNVSTEYLGIEENGRPNAVVMKLDVGPDTLWVAGQEIYSSGLVNEWMDSLTNLPYVTRESIGRSVENREMAALEIGSAQATNLVMVICRQHPPEVTGYLAMRTFVETVTGDTELAQEFRDKFKVFVVPLMNPDGVDNGHWRHNSSGIDLNRDWSDFNQPETRNVRDFMHRKVKETSGEFNFGIDFHSTWDDIYYTIDSTLEGNMPGLVYSWLDGIQTEISGYVPNVSSSDKMVPTTVSRNYFYTAFGAESLVYEIGDNTDRAFVEQKGKVAAEVLMEEMLNRVEEKVAQP